jgi:hypothetical protein
MPKQWWIQLIESSPLVNHQLLRQELAQRLNVPCHRFVWGTEAAMPEAISLQGDDNPPDIYGILGTVQKMFGPNEYMCFVVMVEADTLSRNAVYHVLVSRYVLARVETGKTNLDEARSLVLEADEELRNS